MEVGFETTATHWEKPTHLVRSHSKLETQTQPQPIIGRGWTHVAGTQVLRIRVMTMPLIHLPALVSFNFQLVVSKKWDRSWQIFSSSMSSWIGLKNDVWNHHPGNASQCHFVSLLADMAKSSANLRQIFLLLDPFQPMLASRKKASNTRFGLQGFSRFLMFFSLAQRGLLQDFRSFPSESENCFLATGHCTSEFSARNQTSWHAACQQEIICSQADSQRYTNRPMVATAFTARQANIGFTVWPPMETGRRGF